eukprot:6217400-Prorocentrum_lima.AAC.1
MLPRTASTFCAHCSSSLTSTCRFLRLRGPKCRAMELDTEDTGSSSTGPMRRTPLHQHGTENATGDSMETTLTVLDMVNNKAQDGELNMMAGSRQLKG